MLETPTINKPVAKTFRSPKLLTIFPHNNPEEKRAAAKMLITAPAAAWETPNERANNGMAGAITPKPTATRKATEESTATSRGRSLNGDFIGSEAIVITGEVIGVAIVSKKYAVVAENLVKTYGTTRALDGLSLEVEEGTVLGVLGPNGAGKTTTVRILATLLAPDSGNAHVAGIDVIKDPQKVRELIGLSGQYAAVDETLTGWDNLVMFGRLYHLNAKGAKERATQLLEQFSLTDAARRPIKTYSGGMRRRLDLAASLIIKPKVLFLDEPTTGLDPRGRLEMWEVIDELVKGGVTLLLTTQYLEEADQLADEIAVIDHGKVIARGTSDSLKKEVGGERLEVTVEQSKVAETAKLLSELTQSKAHIEEGLHRISVVAHGGSAMLIEAVRALDAAQISPLDIGLKRPSLDDVFMSLTGHVAEEISDDVDSGAKSNKRGKRGNRK
jgi:ABC-2 type transport system ATP-binding protein